MCYASHMTTFQKYQTPSELLFQIADDENREDIATIAGRVKHAERTLATAVMEFATVKMALNRMGSSLTKAADDELRALTIPEKKDLVATSAGKMGYTREDLADRIGLDREHLADLPAPDPFDSFLASLFSTDPSSMSDDELVKTLDDMLANLPNPEGETDGQRSDI